MYEPPRTIVTRPHRGRANDAGREGLSSIRARDDGSRDDDLDPRTDGPYPDVVELERLDAHLTDCGQNLVAVQDAPSPDVDGVGCDARLDAGSITLLVCKPELALALDGLIRAEGAPPGHRPALAT